jgi:maltooligosyltrehalose trehalohydrolase
MKRHHAMPFGATVLERGGVQFRLWAPDVTSVDLLLQSPAGGEALHPMRAQPDGWFEVVRPGAGAGWRYAFRLGNGQQVPDPASRYNPDDAHGLSAVIDPRAFVWPDMAWRGRPWHEAVVYELHIGCFTPEGTFRAAIDRLDHLVALGVTAIALMPVADFPGRHGWGYDGVLLYAPDASYGTPDDLKALVAAAHARGLMVLLDVVYNHFGPDGNYLHAYAKAFFNERVPTPWGAAINFDAARSETVRSFFIHNALYWLEEFHFDGLRVDAVHAMHDGSPTHFVDDLSLALREGPGRTRAVHVVLENHDNDAARLARDALGGPWLADAQWNDDVHHALHVLATGETDGYYADYATAPLHDLGRGLAEGFVYQGQPSAHADGRPRGTPSALLPPTAFVNSLQTHDQVGNRAHGDRIAQQLAAEGPTPAQRDGRALHVLTACLLLSPATPMLFMGEEFAASTPFQYFCDFTGDLAQAVTEGRRAEFGRFARFADPAQRSHIPDPNDPATFQRSKLNWADLQQEPHRSVLRHHTALLHLRQRELVPHLPQARSGRWDEPAPGSLHVRWPLGQGRHWHLLAQLSDQDGPAHLAAALPGRRIYQSHAQGLPAWSVTVSLEAA